MRIVVLIIIFKMKSAATLFLTAALTQALHVI